MFEPRSPEEEATALMAALDSARGPSTAVGSVSLGLCAMLLYAIATVGPSDRGILGMVVAFTLISAVGPGLLVASGVQRGRGSDTIPGYVRQARLLTAFWWVAAITGLSFLTLNALALVAGFALSA